MAEMLMHLLRTVAVEARCAKLLQGEAAGRSMAVPVNWRACSRAGVERLRAARGLIAACGYGYDAASFSPVRAKHGKHVG